MRGKIIKLQIWDTAGQERYHSITPTYFRGVHGVFLVYDVKRRESFDNITKWIKMTNESVGNEMLMMLLGNKCDLNSRRVVHREQGERMAIKNSIRFRETSARDDINVDKAFFELAEAILDKMQMPGGSSSSYHQPRQPFGSTIRLNEPPVQSVSYFGRVKSWCMAFPSPI